MIGIDETTAPQQGMAKRRASNIGQALQTPTMLLQEILEMVEVLLAAAAILWVWIIEILRRCNESSRRLR